MAKKKKSSQQPIKSCKLTPCPQQPRISSFEGERLDDLLLKLGRSIEEAKKSKGDLPERIWLKQHFAIGVNEVTRVLERMPRANAGDSEGGESVDGDARRRAAPLVPLQVVILASDAKPRTLTKHIPDLASSRKVGVISVKDNRGGSLRLGELMTLKTSMAVGVKARGSFINKLIDEILLEDPFILDSLQTIQGSN